MSRLVTSLILQTSRKGLKNGNFAMPRTTLVRAQADAAEAMIDRIAIGIAGYGGDGAAFPLSLNVARLGNILRIQFSLADRHLYPFMIRSGQREAARIAREFQGEICHFGKRLDRFIQCWSSSSAIASDIGHFRCEAEALLTHLRHRLQRERRDLYPLADALANSVFKSDNDDMRRQRAGGMH